MSSITEPTSRAGGPAAVGRRAAWLPVAAVLLGGGWGSNQVTPLLLVYHHALSLGTGTLEAMFGVYALGLIPGLLLAGQLSDARGRRTVIVPAAAVSLLASAALVAGAHAVALLFAGRFLTGIGSGAIFGAGTAWLRELSKPPFDDAGDHAAARRAAVAMTAGFALGPLVAGVLAQWAPAPRVVPYVPHLALMALVLVLLRGVPETVTVGAKRVSFRPHGLATPRFRRVVVPMAPWVFTAPGISFALLPSVVHAGEAADGVALTAAVALLAALCGVLIQPFARRLDRHAERNRAATIGLIVLAAGLLLSVVTVESGRTWLLLPCAVVFGSAYGLCMVAGLVEVQRLADPASLASLTAVYYALTYLGLCVPFVLAAAAHLASYPTLLAICAALALLTAASVTRGAGRVGRGSRPEPAATRP